MKPDLQRREMLQSLIHVRQWRFGSRHVQPSFGDAEGQAMSFRGHPRWQCPRRASRKIGGLQIDRGKALLQTQSFIEMLFGE